MVMNLSRTGKERTRVAVFPKSQYYKSEICRMFSKLVNQFCFVLIRGNLRGEVTFDSVNVLLGNLDPSK